MPDSVEIASEPVLNNKQRFRALFLKWWLILFLARAILISVAGFGGNLLIFMAMGPITMWVGILTMLMTPEFDIAVNLFGGVELGYWLVIPVTLFLIAVTSALVVALAVFMALAISSAALEKRDSN